MTTPTNTLTHADDCTSDLNLRLRVSKTGRHLIICNDCGAARHQPHRVNDCSPSADHAFRTGRPYGVSTPRGVVVCRTRAEYDAAKAGAR